MGNVNAALVFLRAFLDDRIGRFQVALRDKERGASAVELAIITAVIIGIAGIVLGAITIFVQNQSNTIKGGGG